MLASIDKSACSPDIQGPSTHYKCKNENNYTERGVISRVKILGKTKVAEKKTEMPQGKKVYVLENMEERQILYPLSSRLAEPPSDGPTDGSGNRKLALRGTKHFEDVVC